MWSQCVACHTPALNQDPGLQQRVEDLSIQQFIPQFPGEGLGIGDSYRLKRAQSISVSWKQASPAPYQPGTGCHLEDMDWESESRTLEGERPGQMDLKVISLFRDGHPCRQCEIRVTLETSETDHIKPVHGFASYAQASWLLNLQTLCLACHNQKTRAR